MAQATQLPLIADLLTLLVIQNDDTQLTRTQGRVIEWLTGIWDDESLQRQLPYGFERDR